MLPDIESEPARDLWLVSREGGDNLPTSDFKAVGIMINYSPCRYKPAMQYLFIMNFLPYYFPVYHHWNNLKLSKRTLESSNQFSIRAKEHIWSMVFAASNWSDVTDSVTVQK
jgi:hypothetical protein